MIYFTQQEIAEVYRLLGHDPPPLVQRGRPSPGQLEAAGIRGDHEIEGVSYGLDMLALLSLASPDLHAKVNAYLAERGWDLPEITAELEEIRRRLAPAIKREE